MARELYVRQLEELKSEILKMGGCVERAIQEAIRSLARADLSLARQVIREDDIVDRLNEHIEHQCIRLFALQQPVGRDLRTVSTAFKVVTDLERIGDEAVNIAVITLRLGGEATFKPLIDIPRMALIAQEMVKNSLDSFVREDVDLARAAALRDDEVDQIYSALFDELVGFVLEGGDRRIATQAINLLFVARYLERIADHAANIAERVVYMVTGERVIFNREPAGGEAGAESVGPAPGQSGSLGV